ncbi:MAG: 3-deoxy-manno-octulosonate cytidylyltransferase [Kiritimatiellaeota bacterium]|nr:3-deoxy-manno-octulosonate cytidylyltransferase [Kiritimatiellota bacterium]
MSNEKVVVVIPARYESTRFPGKLLANLDGKPIVQWVYEKASRTKADEVWVAVDDARIADVVADFGGKFVMTSPDHPSGTDRIHEALRSVSETSGGFDIVVNLQGDEPLVHPGVVDQLIDMMLSDESIEMGTIAVEKRRGEIETDPNKVKVVVATPASTDGGRIAEALYFTRAATPYLRDGGEDCGILLHWGIYAYRSETLAKIVSFPQSPLEKCEKLEQLRALENGVVIHVLKTSEDTIGIDTPEDLEEARRIVAESR